MSEEHPLLHMSVLQMEMWIGVAHCEMAVKCWPHRKDFKSSLISLKTRALILQSRDNRGVT